MYNMYVIATIFKDRQTDCYHRKESDLMLPRTELFVVRDMWPVTVCRSCFLSQVLMNLFGARCAEICASASH